MLRSVDKKKATGPFFLALPQRKLPAKQTSNMLLIVSRRNVVVVVVSHIQRIGCQPEKTTLHGGQSRSWPAKQGKKEKKKKKSESASPPPPPPPPRARLVRRKKEEKK